MQLAECWKKGSDHWKERESMAQDKTAHEVVGSHRRTLDDDKKKLAGQMLISTVERMSVPHCARPRAHIRSSCYDHEKSGKHCDLELGIGDRAMLTSILIW